MGRGKKGVEVEGEEEEEEDTGHLNGIKGKKATATGVRRGRMVEEGERRGGQGKSKTNTTK